MLLYLFQTNQLLLPEMEKPSLPVHQNNPGETHGTLTVDCDSVEARAVGAGLIMGGEMGMSLHTSECCSLKGFVTAGVLACYCRDSTGVTVTSVPVT